GWLGTYTSSPRGFRTNSYWIEGSDGVILIDTQFLPSAAIEAVELAELVTGKKVVTAFVLHANPDKFNGTSALQDRGIQVLTSQQVAELIPEVHKLRHSWFYDRFKPDYPDQAPTPDSFGDSTREMSIAGVTLQLHVVGAGCSESHVVVEYDGHVFVGDLVASLGHAWLELGRIDEWQARLEEIEQLAPDRVHPGRGPSGGPELLIRQRRYLEQVVAYVQAVQPRRDMAEADKDRALERVKTLLVRDYPGYGFVRFVEIGLPAIWDSLAAKTPPPSPNAPEYK
ncbi:MAG: MBL fold metallo-hydrolase, partial [Myxococcota bacterium]